MMILKSGSLIYFLTGLLWAQSGAPVVAVQTVIDSDKLAVGSPFMLQFFQEKPVGSMILTTKLVGNQIMISDHTRVAAMNIDERLFSELDAHLNLKSFSGEGHFGDKPIDIKLRVDGNQIKGHVALASQPRKEIDQAWPAGAIERTALFALIPAMRLEIRDAFTLNVFDPLQGLFKQVIINISEPEEVKVASGTFKAYKVALSNGENLNFYVSEAKPHRTVKIELTTMPWAYELLHEAFQ